MNGGKTLANNHGDEGVGRLRIIGWSAAVLILLVPLIAMQFTDEVMWDLADFIFMGILLAGVGIVLELTARKTGNSAYKTGVALALAAAFITIWVNGAVGIIGNEDNDANLMYYGVLLVGVIGALIARFEAAGMVRAMVATAVAQGLVFVIALVAGWGFTGPITLFFLAFWLGAARLFQKAASGGVEQEV